MYPKIEINVEKINENIKIVKNICQSNNIKLSLVTKVLCGNMKVIEAINFDNIDSISDSRINNLKSLVKIKKEKWLIRIPSKSEIEDVIKFCDVSFNSSIETISLLNEEAKKQNKKHKIILMYELGDLREGISYDKLSDIIKKRDIFSNIEIYGLGANLTCYGGIAPSKENTEELFNVASLLEKENGIKLQVLTGANSSSFMLLESGDLKNKMNYVRFGESVFLGNIPGYDKKIAQLNSDCFIISAEISELEQKESIPKGEILKNSFGEVPEFIDKGIRKHALVNIGKLDVSVNLKPIDPDIVVLEGSSDYLILDLTDSKIDYKVGDIITFIPDYLSLLMAMSSSYVTKEIKL